VFVSISLEKMATRWVELYLYSKAVNLLGFIVLTALAVGSYRAAPLPLGWCLGATLSPLLGWLLAFGITEFLIKRCHLAADREYKACTLACECLLGLFYVGWLAWGVELLLAWELSEPKDVVALDCVFLSLLSLRSIAVLLYFVRRCSLSTLK